MRMIVYQLHRNMFTEDHARYCEILAVGVVRMLKLSDYSQRVWNQNCISIRQFYYLAYLPFTLS